MDDDAYDDDVGDLVLMMTMMLTMALMMMSDYGTNLLSHHTPSASQLF